MQIISNVDCNMVSKEAENILQIVIIFLIFKMAFWLFMTFIRIHNFHSHPSYFCEQIRLSYI